MKKQIRRLFQQMGYDIVKAAPPAKTFEGRSAYEQYSYHPTPIGNYYLPGGTDNDVIAQYMKTGRFFEPEVIEVARQYIKPGTAVLDIGANFGQMSIEFARLVGEGGMVYSFEAQQLVFDVLQKNCDANYPGRIRPFYAAVYNETGKTMVFPQPDFSKFGSYGSFGLGSGQSEKGTAVKTITIDSLDIRQPISFLKVDVQGSDLFAMQGAIETIRKHRMPVLFEFEQQFQQEFNTSFQQYVDFVRSINYSFSRTLLDINFLILPNQ